MQLYRGARPECNCTEGPGVRLYRGAGSYRDSVSQLRDCEELGGQSLLFSNKSQLKLIILASVQVGSSCQRSNYSVIIRSGSENG